MTYTTGIEPTPPFLIMQILLSVKRKYQELLLKIYSKICLRMNLMMYLKTEDL